jgi:hypothetical protein
VCVCCRCLACSSLVVVWSRFLYLMIHPLPLRPSYQPALRSAHRPNGHCLRSKCVWQHIPSCRHKAPCGRTPVSRSLRFACPTSPPPPFLMFMITRPSCPFLCHQTATCTCPRTHFIVSSDLHTLRRRSARRHCHP